MDLIPNADGRFAMDAFYGVMPPSDELNQLITVSQTTFRGLEPWLNAQCDHPRGQELIPLIQVQVRDYCETLDHSVKIAVAGVGVADKAKDIYWGLAGVHELTSDTLEEFISDVKEEARDLKTGMSELVCRLRENRQGIFAISSALDNARRAVEQEQQEHQQEIKESRNAALNSVFSSFVKLSIGVLGRSMSSSKGMDLVFLIPPLLSFADGAVKQWYQYAHDVGARGKQEKLCEEAIQQLQSAGKDLHTLEDQVGKMVNWWFDLDTQFNHISKNMEDIRINASLRERMKKLAREFEKFQIQLQDYMHSMTTIQDYYSVLLQYIPEDR